MVRIGLVSASLSSVWLLCLAAGVTADDGGYREEIERWRQKRLDTLKADDGWLTVSGLFWLKPGETKIGSDPRTSLAAGANARFARARSSSPTARPSFTRPRRQGTRNGTPFRGRRAFIRTPTAMPIHSPSVT